jgi:ABC-type sugar transport system permease subunit
MFKKKRANMQNPLHKFFATRQGRIAKENLTAYLFIFPAVTIIFIFGLFPVAFAFFVSLHRWRRFPEGYEGLANYTQSLGDFAYVLFIGLALGMLIYAVVRLVRIGQKAAGHQARVWVWLVPGALSAGAIAAFTYWFFIVLPFILDAPRRVPRGRAGSRQAFLDEFFASFKFPDATRAARIMLVVVGCALVVLVAWWVLVKGKERADYLIQFTLTGLLIIGGAWLLYLTGDAIQQAADAAHAANEDLPVWSYTAVIGAGVILFGMAYWLWRRAVQELDDRRFGLLVLAALALLAGSYLLIVQIPQALQKADEDMMRGFWITLLYVVGTVPVQLGLGLFFAYRLFHAERFKSVFRMLFFMPYITPFAATSVVFATLFSNRPLSMANRLIGVFGIGPQKWLSEPTPVNELIFGRSLPQIIQGPSLALLVIILWSTWTYAGYDIVIFLAGLGNISPEYYEAARIDGASGWKIFRNVTLPLLSPTTFFLSLLAIIGTFQAFTQIWMMRQPAAYDAVDTVGVYLYVTVSSRNNLGYGAALAFVLFGVILVVTVFQNRIMGRRVFYG